METRTRGKETIDRGLQGSVGTLANVSPTRLSKRSYGCPLTEGEGELIIKGQKDIKTPQLLTYEFNV